MSEIKKGTPKRGVSVYSYASVMNVSMTLEDVFKDMYDMGATCFEFLASDIQNYPNPSVEWIDHYFALCEKYKMQPAEMGHWAETHLKRGPRMTDEEIIANLVRDFKLANLLGFKSLRTKITCINEYCDPEPEWEHVMELALPYAEKYDVAMLSEVHAPTTLTRQHIYDYLEFADKHNTKHFGINVDFGTFVNPDDNGYPEEIASSLKSRAYKEGEYSKPEDIIPILPYSKTCHAKFNYITRDFKEPGIPYEKILNIMVDHGWSGNLVSEYEGPGRDDVTYLSDQLRRHHIMMQNILGY